MPNSFLLYLESEKRYSHNTILSYKTDLDEFQSFLDKYNKKILLANYNDIRNWIVYLHNQNFSNRSINRKITALRTFYKYQQKIGKLTDNPAKKITLLKLDKKLPSFVEESDIKLLLDDLDIATEDYIVIIAQAIFELFYATGIRISELVNLKEIDIDYQKLTIKVLGKRNKERIIPISTRLSKILKNYQISRNEVVNEILDNDYYFLTKKGKKLYKKFVYNQISYYLSRVTTIKKKSPHIMRHTFATHMLNQGADINLIKEILGHSSLASTQIYTHNSIEKLKEVYKQAHPKA